MLLRRTEEAAKYLEATKLQTSNGYSEEFTVMDDLMGLAIGGRIIFFSQSTNIFFSKQIFFNQLNIFGQVLTAPTSRTRVRSRAS